MKTQLIVMILLSILLTSSAQIALKHGMSDPRVQELLATRDYISLFVALATSVWIVGGLVIFASSVLLWLSVLAAVPLSTAYPFVALGICITTAAGFLLFHEPISMLKLSGTALIIAGIICISASG